MTAPDQPKGVATMAIVRWVLVAVAALVAVVSIAGSLRTRSPGTSTTESAQQLWQCPMHPSIIQDHPGECPICGMTLVPKAKASAPSPEQKPAVPGLSAIDLTPERIQLIGMRTEPVKREALSGELRAVGVVAASERGL